MKNISLSIFVTLSVLFTGCALFGGKSAPTKFEHSMFNVQTNTVDEIMELVQAMLRTNISGVVESEVVTTLQTNTVETYVLTPKPEAQENAKAIGGLANLIAPGTGNIVGGILAGALGVWARMRSYKKSGTVLAQNIEGIREFVKTSIPEGGKYDAAIVKFMKDKQQEAGVVQGVLAILETRVTNSGAKNAVLEIQGLLDNLKKQA
jgi:hypothetical protein